ncbi:MAG: transketolase [Candidatus Omnitrophica bacterium]|nr:transketolase [Candidatus Omnitrophota bacterium]
MGKTDDFRELKIKAISLRRNILKMLQKAGSGHTGGSLSIVEILVDLYYRKMNIGPEIFESKKRDKFVLSKGHGCPALYAVLADLGFFPEEDLWELRQLGSKLQGHPQLGLPGLEISSGSLGQGLSVAMGMALADRMDGVDARVYCLMGDGETNEGQVWEAAMTAAHYNLDNLCGIIDFNKLQIDGMCCEVKDMGAYKHKWESFGWHAVEVDGHDLEALDKAFEDVEKVKGRPQVVIAHTVKGKGISFIENKVEWHGIAPKEDELEKALAELDEQEKALDAERKGE